MAICNSACVVRLPQCYSDGCDQITRQGGIPRLIFLACDVDYKSLDLTLQATWDTLIADGNAIATGLLLGEKPEGSYVEKKINSCAPAQLTGGEKTLTFEDYGYESKDGLNEGMGSIRFYNVIMNAPAKYLLMWYTCDGWLYGVVEDFTLQADEVIPNDKQEFKYVKGTVKFLSKLMIESIYAPNLDFSCTAPDSSSSPVLP